MLKRYTFWLWAAVAFQVLTAIFHTIGIFVQPEPVNETERQLMQLMHTYQFDAGAGFHPTMADLVTALSSCFTFVCLLGGMSIACLLKKKAGFEVLKAIVAVNIVIFGAVFTVMAILTFLPPILFTGLVFISLSVGYIVLRAGDSDRSAR